MARELPSLNALRAFEAAARLGSFTRAAEELHVTHAAISRHVRALETWLEVPLFRRLSRGVVLTEAGQRYQRRLTRLFDELVAATAAVRRPRAAGALVVSVENAFAARWLVPRLGRFQEAFPDIDLEIDPNDDRVNFRNDPAELAIRFGEGLWDDVEVRGLVALESFPVCSPDLRESYSLSQPEALRQAPLLHEETRQWWAEWLKAAGIEDLECPRGTMLQNAHLAIQAAEAGQGVALADNLTAADAIRAGRLVRLFDITMPGGGYYIVRPEHLPESPAARAFREWLEAEIDAFELLPDMGSP